MLEIPGAFSRSLLPQPRHAERRTAARSGAWSSGGSQAYVQRADRAVSCRLRTGFARYRRAPSTPTRVEIELADGTHERFDHVVLACHSDQALRLLRDPTTAEREVLGAIPYQDNEVVLHTDTRLLPRRKRAWAAWNYHVLARDAATRARSRYNMNMLQGLDAPETFCVTLNRSADIDPRKVLTRLHYAHPCTRPPRSRRRRASSEINGAAAHGTAAPTGATASTKTASCSALEALRAASRPGRRSMHSASTTGWVRHRRFAPRAHAFRYRLFMALPRPRPSSTRVSRPLVVVDAPARRSPVSARRLPRRSAVPLDQAVRDASSATPACVRAGRSACSRTALLRLRASTR